MGSKRRFGITSDLSGLSQGLMVNNISFTEDSQVAEARNQYGQLVDLAVYANDKNVTIDGLYLGDMLSGGSVINIGSEQYMVTSTARGETNIGFQTGTVNAQRISGDFSPIPPQPPTPTEPSITFNIPNNIIWDFETNTTSSINFANYVAATPNSTGINYELTDQLYTTLPNGVVFNDGVLSANKSQMSDDYSTILSLNVSASFSGGTSLISTSPTFNFIVENVVEPVYNIPLTFKGLSSTNAIKLQAIGSPDPIVLKAKINDGDWNSVTVDQNTYFTARLNQGDTIAFSGANETFSKDEDNYFKFAMTGQIEASGNIQSLMNFSPSATSYCYYRMFDHCDRLITAPELPATSLVSGCYYSMFFNCYNLTAAPDLPASILAPKCYQYMFYNCINLSTAPDLPATSSVYQCYLAMFYNCSSLSSISINLTNWKYMDTYTWVKNVADQGIFYKPSALSAIYDDSHIPTNWQVVNKEWFIPLTFKGVDSTNAIKLQAIGSPYSIDLQYNKNDTGWTNYTIGDIISLNDSDTVAFSGANNLFSKNSSNYYQFAMTGQIAASGNTMSLMNFSDSCTTSCYDGLFLGCTSLKKAPQLPATILAPSCYAYMFADCKSLTSIPYLPATRLKQFCYCRMFGNCFNLSTAPALPATGLAKWCYSNMFYQCINLSTAPALPAMNLAEGCYYSMFYWCNSLKNGPELPASSLASNCYRNMFEYCQSLTAGPALTAMTLALSCYYGMFYGCGSMKGLFQIPTSTMLPATTLAPDCYDYMFYGCSRLESISVSFTDWRWQYQGAGYMFTQNWMSGVVGTGRFYKPADLTTIKSVDYIPSGWTVYDF